MTTCTGSSRLKHCIFLQNCAIFVYFITEISNTQVENENDFDVAMSIYNSLEYGDNYPKANGNIDQYTRDNPVYTDGGNPLVDNSTSFKL